VARVEANTGIQIVPAVTGKSDNYPEIPWKAFAIGASLGGLALVVADRVNPHWTTNETARLHMLVVLGAGAVAELLAIFAPPFARLLLSSLRASVEVRQQAESLFLRHGLSSTAGRVGVLLLVSLFERRIEIVADTGFAGRVAPADWQAVIARMTPHLQERRPYRALHAALEAIEQLLAGKGFQALGTEPNELANGVIEDRGE